MPRVDISRPELLQELVAEVRDDLVLDEPPVTLQRLRADLRRLVGANVISFPK